MKKYFYFIIFILFILLSPKTYAYVNTDTAWIIENNNQKQRLQNTVCGDETAYDVIKDFIDNFDVDNAYANVEIYLTLQSGGVQTANNISFYVWPKSYPMRSEFWAIGRPNHGTIHFTTEHYYETFTSGQYFYYIEIKAANCSSNSSNITSANGWQSFLTFVNTGVLNSSQSTSTVSSFNKHSAGAFSPYWSDTIASINGSNLGVDIEESSFVVPYNWIYYTSRPFIYGHSSNCVTSANLLCKNVILNGVEYTFGDTIPDTYTIDEGPPTPPSPSYIGYSTSLNTFYTSLLPSDVTNYELSFDFKVLQSVLGTYQEPLEYIENTSFDILCSGRVNNSNYYSYEKFNCSLDSSYIYDTSRVTYTFDNFSTNSSLTNYDKIYVTIVPKYLDNNVSTIVFDYSYSYSLGDIINTPYKGLIFENFTNLPLNFKLYLSSNNDIVNSNVYINNFNFNDYSISIRGYSNITNKQNLVVGSSVLGSLNSDDNNDYFSVSITNDIDTGLLIFQNNSSITLPNLQLFFNDGIILSFDNNSNSSDFYYIDNTGTIVNNTITISYISDNNSYDISYYINIVNSFLNDLTNDTIEISSLTQSFYNSLPLFFQSFIFVIFILFCTYFVYILIKR